VDSASVDFQRLQGLVKGIRNARAGMCVCVYVCMCMYVYRWHTEWSLLTTSRRNTEYNVDAGRKIAASVVTTSDFMPVLLQEKASIALLARVTAAHTNVYPFKRGMISPLLHWLRCPICAGGRIAVFIQYWRRWEHRRGSSEERSRCDR